jgi:seryl-tRNA synthetase
MERVHGVRRVSKVLVEAQEPVVAVPVEELVPVAAEILRTLDLSWDNLVQVVARMVKLLGMV